MTKASEGGKMKSSKGSKNMKAKKNKGIEE